MMRLLLSSWFATGFGTTVLYNWKKHVPENLQRKSPEYVKEFQSSSQMPFVMRMPLVIAHVTAGFGPAAAHAKSQWPLL
jgi:predicted oxidoreductase (fatty acid repression mutant protein)